MTKAENRKEIIASVEAYLAKGGVITKTKAKAPRKGELLNTVTAMANAGRWYRGGQASTHDARYASNNTI
jgi:hypothetical protein|tara:strand:- start:95 stop:304 length:210 start_codon:yes stop_codon:yes gene_type:complete